MVEQSDKLMTLHGYWRSGCSWRIRTALNLKGFTDDQVEHKYVHLVKDGGQQHSEEYKALNPSEVRKSVIFI